MTDRRLQAEIDRRKALGHSPVTLTALTARLAELGYKLDRSMDCQSNNRYITGELAGVSYPAVNAYVVEADSGRSFAHFESRRDANFRKLQELRCNEAVYSVVRGRIFEL